MNILITAGGTKEAIDKVRYITNMSSGALGREILIKAQREVSIENIYFLSPKTAFPSDDRVMSKTHLIRTESVDDLQKNLHEILTTKKIDIVIHSMAVSDYKVDYVATLESMVEATLKFVFDFNRTGDPFSTTTREIIEHLKKGEFKIDTSSKMSSKNEDPIIALSPTQKVISNIKKWAPDTVLVGFKLLEGVTDKELVYVAREQMKKNDCDLVWSNDIKRIRESGHQGFIVEKDKVTYCIRKEVIAKNILDVAITYVEKK